MNESTSAALDLAWSLWGELGVPSAARRHSHWLADPEPLLVWTPLVAEHDARLRDEIFRWGHAHADRLSMTRLRGLLHERPTNVAASFGGLAATLAEAGSKGWPQQTGIPPWPRRPKPRRSPCPVDRPALAALRLRALAGVGARADLLTALATHSESWRSARDLEWLGYTKRSIARLLEELNEAGYLRRRAQRNSMQYTLVNRPLWTRLAGVDNVVPIDIAAVGSFVHHVLTVAQSSAKPIAVRRVDAVRQRAALEQAASLLELPSPPSDDDAATDLMQWGLLHLKRLAHGA